MAVNLGSNDFYDIPFPLVLADRFFHMYNAQIQKPESVKTSDWEFAQRFPNVECPCGSGKKFKNCHGTTPSINEYQLDIFRWDDKEQKAIYEVKASSPIEENITTNPTGIVTFGEPSKGNFLYKFRPKEGVSQIFGKIPISDEFEVKVNDHSIVVLRGGKQIGNIENNKIGGSLIGIRIGADGSFAMGDNKLPDGMVIQRT